ncbi:unnamed protein product [Rotaria sp. Silwood2]|nr:unnamed protein product [Rotaria sp. Silwood2]CAF3131651.1 unnamed protein product [Rotaria sp. Silwood2]CAF4205125.1 unnamed protein product [Rotaria sp. Silwood2]CAF4298552.1 unnamed protein product [Rotaria sp. Silwood2]CAF4393924.1 unnamed protein product [Rotaria sp. Silwood2]
MLSSVRRFFKFLHWLYLQYLLNTALYMLEPWERVLFSTLLFAIISTAIYSAWVFLPVHNNSKQHQRSAWYYPLSELIQHYYMQFLLTTTLYVMEPWERILVIMIIILLISLVTYSAFIYIPFHVHNILESTIPIITDVFKH